MNSICIAGIGTGVGKTLVSALLCERLGADYWKPIQSGTATEPSDSSQVARLIQNGPARVLESAYSFREPLSPHIAARLDHTIIDHSRLTVPVVPRPLVVELAGGLMVPVDDTTTNLDLLRRWAIPVVLVSRHYLGSINHTLLSVEALKNADVPLAGIVFNGRELPDTERVICSMTKARIIGRLPELPEISRQVIKRLADTLEDPR